ncbi:MAG: hypothetical protein K1X82_15335 [Bacteroidia bacterium]|nr:hypothetical protein [Bacteroidia bacterium]
MNIAIEALIENGIENPIEIDIESYIENRRIYSTGNCISAIYNSMALRKVNLKLGQFLLKK